MQPVPKDQISTESNEFFIETLNPPQPSLRKERKSSFFGRKVSKDISSTSSQKAIFRKSMPYNSSFEHENKENIILEKFPNAPRYSPKKKKSAIANTNVRKQSRVKQDFFRNSIRTNIGDHVDSSQDDTSIIQSRNDEVILDIEKDFLHMSLGTKNTFSDEDDNVIFPNKLNTRKQSLVDQKNRNSRTE